MRGMQVIKDDEKQAEEKDNGESGRSEVYGGERYVWLGQSGKSYAYRVTPFPVYRCDIPEINGNSIFTRQEKNSVEYIPVYIGYGNLYEFFVEDPSLIRRIFDKGAGQIHFHIQRKTNAYVHRRNR